MIELFSFKLEFLNKKLEFKHRQNSYRLGEYLISELPDGRIWWTLHSGFAIQIGGPCHVLGNVLLMGDPCSEENGFMKSEFLDLLDRLPLWNKVQYYCSSSSLMDSATGKFVNAERLRQLSHPQSAIRCKAAMAERSENFRLGRYQISITTEGLISWKSHAGMAQIAEGPGMIESDILVIEPKQSIIFGKSKKEFLHTLQLFPKWIGTAFWSQGTTLKPIIDKEKSKYDHAAAESHGMPKTAERHLKRQKEFFKQIWPSISVHKITWAEGKMPKWLENKKSFWKKSN